MKIIIDIPEKVVTAIQNGEDYRFDIHTAIAQGKSYDERSQGEWVIDGKSWGGLQGWRCSLCNSKYDIHKLYALMPYNFCPNCGAKMEVKNNEN